MKFLVNVMKWFVAFSLWVLVGFVGVGIFATMVAFVYLTVLDPSLKKDVSEVWQEIKETNNVN